MEANNRAITRENNLPELVQDKNGNTKALEKAVRAFDQTCDGVANQIKKTATALEELSRKNTYNQK
jgi:DNA-binding FrmR family transcriptional regulator